MKVIVYARKSLLVSSINESMALEEKELERLTAGPPNTFKETAIRGIKANINRLSMRRQLIEESPGCDVQVEFEL